MNLHTHIHACIHTYIYVCICNDINTVGRMNSASEPTHTHTCIHTYIYACICNNINTVGRMNSASEPTHTYIHAYIHTHMHAYIYTHIQLQEHSRKEKPCDWNLQTHTYTHACMHAYLHTHTHTYNYRNTVGRRNHASGTCKRNIHGKASGVLSLSLSHSVTRCARTHTHACMEKSCKWNLRRPQSAGQKGSKSHSKREEIRTTITGGNTCDADIHMYIACT